MIAAALPVENIVYRQSLCCNGILSSSSCRKLRSICILLEKLRACSFDEASAAVVVADVTPVASFGLFFLPYQHNIV